MTKEGEDESDSTEPSAEELLENLELFEPYTTDELAETLDTDRGVIRNLLDRLVGEKKVRNKKPPSSPTIWIREPPLNQCQHCEYEFEVKFLHPVFSSVQYCPRCGKRV